jgi:hypothetical protein
MASKPAKPAPYRPRHKRAWVRRHDRRSRFPAPTVATFLLSMPTLRRDELGRIAERAIDRMDAMDGDVDLENATNLEDDFTLTTAAVLSFDRSPGCPIADAGGQCDEDEINTAFGNKDWEAAGGAGCPISDAGGGNVEDEGQINEVAPYTGPLAIEKGSAI